MVIITLDCFGCAFKKVKHQGEIEKYAGPGIIFNLKLDGTEIYMDNIGLYVESSRMILF